MCRNWNLGYIFHRVRNCPNQNDMVTDRMGTSFFGSNPLEQTPSIFWTKYETPVHLNLWFEQWLTFEAFIATNCKLFALLQFTRHI